LPDCSRIRAGAAATPAQGGKLQDSEQVRQRIEQTGPATYKIGDVQVDAASRQLVFSGEINMATGLAEVVVCTLWGKLHESVIRTRCSPWIFTSDCFCWFKGRRESGLVCASSDQYGKTAGTFACGRPSERFRSMGGFRELEGMPSGATGRNLQTGEALPDTPWVFIGSYLDTEGSYVADYVGSSQPNYHYRSSVLDCPLEAGQVDDYMYVNSSLVPPVGTPVEIRIAVAQSDAADRSDPGFLQVK
jgi:hypothetical protein